MGDPQNFEKGTLPSSPSAVAGFLSPKGVRPDRDGPRGERGKAQTRKKASGFPDRENRGRRYREKRPRSLVLSKLRRLPHSANREKEGGVLICVLPFAGGKTNVL